MFAMIERDIRGAWIFDKDGVIVNTGALKSKAWDRALREHGREGGAEWYRANIGTSGGVLSQRAVEVFGLTIGWEVFRVRRQTIYGELKKDEAPSIDTTLNFIRRIPRDRFRMGIASSDHRATIKEETRALGVYDLFDVMVSVSDDTPGRSKPDPDIYLLSAERLGIEPRNCVAIEDTTVGVEAAMSAGMRCVGYRNPESGRQDLEGAGAYFITDDLSQYDPIELFDR